MTMSARVLLVEPYLGGSHQAWAEGWREHSRHTIDVVGLPGRHWRRRMRAGAIALAPRVETWIADHGRPDVVAATNMLDRAGFLGVTRGQLGAVPSVQFMHENQLSYPRRPGEPLDTGLAWMQWRGLMVADEIWCNSDHHRRELLAGIERLDPGVPDEAPIVDPAAIEAKTWVAHLGIDLAACRPPTPPVPGSRPLVVSNQRWHHDKDLASVLRAFRAAQERGLVFDIAVLGDPTGGEADALSPLIDALGPAVVARGHLERPAYLEILHRADVVVSAARNENFGLAVAEAIAAGCWPVVPDALAYPDVIPAEFHDASLYGPGDLGTHLREVLGLVAKGASAPEGLATSMRRFDWPTVAEAMDDRLEQLLRRGRAV